MSRYVENARCRACGYRKLGGYSSFSRLCPNCGTRARWAWQIWDRVVERREGWFPRRWVEIDGDEFALTEAEHRGGFVW
jgi:hypothetical protein